MTGGMSGIEISSIVDLSYLQALHDVFSDDMKSRGIEVASAILDEKAVPLTFEFNHCSFCKEIRKTKAGLQVCRASDLYGICVAKEHLERTGQVRPVFYVCKQGLVDFCAPIVVRQDVEGRKREVPVAYFFGGQFRYTGERKDIVTPAEPSLGLLARTAQTLQERPPDSSDLCVRFHQTTYLDETQFHQLEAAATSFTDVLNGVVQKLYDWRRVKRLEDFMAGAATVRGVDELFELVIESVPEMIHARHCSIFTIQRDEPSGCEHLVLRKTSYEKLKAEENSAYYNKGEGLTGWVWEHAHSLRLENLQDPAERMAHGRLDWKHKYNDSDEHRGFLCVPIVGARRDVIGVIRVPHKEPGNFDKYDEIFLNFLAGHLSSVIQCQLAQERFDREGRVAGLVDIATRLGRARSYSRVLDATITGSLALFGGDGKKHFVNILTSDGNYWRVEREVGTLGLARGYQDLRGMTFEIREGLTGLAIHDCKAYISSDLDGSARNGHYIPAVDSGESAMSAPLKWGKEVYGAISIVSNRRFEFSKEEDLPILMRLAELSASAIKKARAREARMKEAKAMRAKARRKRMGRLARSACRMIDWLARTFGGAS